ncbi:hypothetical protein [Arthrobacter monumenti]
MNAERRSLQEAFAPAPVSSTRGTKLAGLLPPKRRNAETSPNVTKPVVAKSDVDIQSSPVPVVGKPKPAEVESASEKVPGPLKNVGVYIEPELLTRLKEWTRQQQVTYSDLLVEAFDHVEDTAIAKEFEPQKVSAEHGMPRRVRRPRGTAGIQIQLRLDRNQVEWLEDKAQRLGAPSRSACVSTVLKLYMSQLQK